MSDLLQPSSSPTESGKVSRRSRTSATARREPVLAAAGVPVQQHPGVHLARARLDRRPRSGGARRARSTDRATSGRPTGQATGAPRPPSCRRSAGIRRSPSSTSRCSTAAARRRYLIDVALPVECPTGWAANTPCPPWLNVYPSHGVVDKEVRATVRVDWVAIPTNQTFPVDVPITVTGSDGSTVEVTARVEDPRQVAWKPNRFIEANGYVSMEADHYSRAIGTDDVEWKVLPDIGRTGSGVTPFPVTAEAQVPGAESPRLEYDMHLTSSGPVNVYVYCVAQEQLPELGRWPAVRRVDRRRSDPEGSTRATPSSSTATATRSRERHTSDNANILRTRAHDRCGG